jgi:hypothetical protein
MAEWFKAHAWKACVGNTTVGSNPTLSATVFKAFLINLDIFWLKDNALEDSANLPVPEDIAADLEAALEQFATIAEDLKK